MESSRRDLFIDVAVNRFIVFINPVVLFSTYLHTQKRYATKGWHLAGNLCTWYQDIKDISRISEVSSSDIKRKLTKFQPNIWQISAEFFKKHAAYTEILARYQWTVVRGWEKINKSLKTAIFWPTQTAGYQNDINRISSGYQGLWYTGYHELSPLICGNLNQRLVFILYFLCSCIQILHLSTSL